MSSRLRATFLTGEHVYLRSLVLDDKEQAVRWFRGPFPVNATAAEEFLREEHKRLEPAEQRLAIVRAAGDEIVGGVNVWSDRRVAFLDFSMAPCVLDADALRSEALCLLIHWLRDEAEMMATDVTIADDEPLTIAAAEEIGMVRTATHREWLARPGGRVDQHHYQALNSNWRIEERTNA